MATRPSQPCNTEFFIPPSYAQIRAKSHRNASGSSPSPSCLRVERSSPRLTPDSPRLSPVRRSDGQSSVVHGRTPGLSMQRIVDAAADALQSSGISLSRTPSEQPSRPGSLVFSSTEPQRTIPNGTRPLHVRHEEGHAIVELEPLTMPGEEAEENVDGEENGEERRPKKKRRRFRRPRRNSTLDKVIRLLEDKRVKDSSQLYQLQDMQLPQLRRVLNIIFVTLGVTFLLAVVVVIIYTTVVDV